MKLTQFCKMYSDAAFQNAQISMCKGLSSFNQQCFNLTISGILQETGNTLRVALFPKDESVKIEYKMMKKYKEPIPAFGPFESKMVWCTDEANGEGYTQVLTCQGDALEMLPHFIELCKRASP